MDFGFISWHYLGSNNIYENTDAGTYRQINPILVVVYWNCSG